MQLLNCQIVRLLPSGSDDEISFAAEIGLNRKLHVDIPRNLASGVDPEERELPQGICELIWNCRFNMNVRATATLVSILFAVLFGQ